MQNWYLIFQCSHPLVIFSTHGNTSILTEWSGGGGQVGFDLTHHQSNYKTVEIQVLWHWFRNRAIDERKGIATRDRPKDHKH